jgi:hypothetical protein
MNFFDNLALYGLTVDILQVGIFAAIIALVLGTFWKHIVAGVGILFCVVVFAMPSKKSDVNVASKNKIEQSVIAPIEPVEPKNEETPKVEQHSKNNVPQLPKYTEEGQAEFMDDCQNIGHFAADVCEKLWYSREEDELNSNGKPIKLKRVKKWNTPYYSNIYYKKIKYGT